MCDSEAIAKSTCKLNESTHLPVCLRLAFSLLRVTPAPTLQKASESSTTPMESKLRMSSDMPPLLLNKTFLHISCVSEVVNIEDGTSRTSSGGVWRLRCPSTLVPAPKGTIVTQSTTETPSAVLLDSRQQSRKIVCTSSTVDGKRTASGGDVGWWLSPLPCDSKSYLFVDTCSAGCRASNRVKKSSGSRPDSAENARRTSLWIDPMGCYAVCAPPSTRHHPRPATLTPKSCAI